MLPPISPRLFQSQSPASSKENVFFLEKNIDRLPERNSPSPGHCVRVSVFKTLSPRTSLSPQPPAPSVSGEAETLSARRSQPEAPAPVIPIFYEKLLAPPVLPRQKVESAKLFFSLLPGGRVNKFDPPHPKFLLAEVKVHPYLASTLYTASFGQEESGTCPQFLSFLQNNSRKLLNVTEEERTFHLLAGCERDFLLPEDFSLVIETFIIDHPQMNHFRDCRDLHRAFVTSVTAGIFFRAQAWRQKKMSLRQFLMLDFPAVLRSLSQDSQDINFLPYFSYDQFYVFYAKFVGLDSDEDSLLSREELSEYEDEYGGFLSPKLVARVMMLNTSGKEELMDYWDFVMFLLAHISACSPAGLEYWFPVLDNDNDGLLSLEDLEEFYADNCLRLLTCDLYISCPVHWEDLRSQLVDLLGHTHLSLTTLKRKASDQLEHLLSAFLKVLAFISNDENEVSTKSELNNIQMYMVRSLSQMEEEL